MKQRALEEWENRVTGIVNPSPTAIEAVTAKADVKWAYGVTTVHSRNKGLLKRTIDSLTKAGFPSPIIYLDNMDVGWQPPEGIGGIVAYAPKVGQMVNWVMALTHLYLTNSTADRYIVFEDDLVASNNLREYLERVPYPEKGYLNLYTHDCNLVTPGPDPKPGWYLSNQKGKGALGTVFNRQAAQDLLSSLECLNRTKKSGGHLAENYLVASDGMVIESLQPLGYKEYIHIPSLLQHTGIGDLSTLNHGYGECGSFQGEDFDLLTLLTKEPSKTAISFSKTAISFKHLTTIHRARREVQTMPTIIQPHFGWLPPISQVQVMTHSRCNADCVFCPYIESTHATGNNRMTDETWERILINLVPFKDTINKGRFCPYLMQEPLIDKTIFKKISDIYDYFPSTRMEVSTNGAALTGSIIDQLLTVIGSRNHEIWVSHHGVNKDTYEHIMKINYERATENLIKLIKASNGRYHIRIRGAGESHDNKHVFFTKNQYLHYWAAMANDHGLNMINVEIDSFRFHDRAATLHRKDRGANQLNMGTIRQIDPQHPFYCPRIDEWIHFSWDGTIVLCCMDYHSEVKLPNINQMSLLDYFHGPEYYNLTEEISGRKGCKPGHICTRCTSPGG